jgi:hypothetical protein
MHYRVFYPSFGRNVLCDACLRSERNTSPTGPLSSNIILKVAWHLISARSASGIVLAVSKSSLAFNLPPIVLVRKTFKALSFHSRTIVSINFLFHDS